jgi:hypothetical protein
MNQSFSLCFCSDLAVKAASSNAEAIIKQDLLSSPSSVFLCIDLQVLSSIAGIRD